MGRLSGARRPPTQRGGATTPLTALSRLDLLIWIIDPRRSRIDQTQRCPLAPVIEWRIRFTENFCGCSLSLPTSQSFVESAPAKEKIVRSVLADTPPNCYLTRAIHTTTALTVARRDVARTTSGRERGTGLAFKRGAGVFIYPPGRSAHVPRDRRPARPARDAAVPSCTQQHGVTRTAVGHCSQRWLGLRARYWR